jgi:acyl-CoA thioesterase-2
MSKTLDQLSRLLKLSPTRDNNFVGQSQDLGFSALFGGQVMGQALSAALETIGLDQYTHSLHAYFLRAGDASQSVTYNVENIRDGKSFSTRRVQAMQNDNVIFYMTASFQLAEEGLEHQDKMPDVAGPENIPSAQDFILANQQYIPEGVRNIFIAEKPIEIRPVKQYNWLSPQKMPAKNYLWIKTNGVLPDDLRIHTCLLAYVSDFNFLPTALMPHGVSYWQPNMQVARLIMRCGFIRLHWLMNGCYLPMRVLVL